MLKVDGLLDYVVRIRVVELVDTARIVFLGMALCNLAVGLISVMYRCWPFPC